MPSPLSAAALLDALYLEVRCRCLDIGAALDRIERAEGGPSALGDPRWAQLQQALKLLGESGAKRAEKIQFLFSDEYDPQWKAAKSA
jgi:hypothetical protein